MVEEEWVWTDISGVTPKEIDSDLVLDPSMHGRYRFLQIERWLQDPRMFLMRDVRGMSTQDIVAMRRKALDREMKEGTYHDRRAADGRGIGDQAEAED